MKYSLWLLILVIFPVVLSGQTLPSPVSHFGFHIGDDYHLANYTATSGYFREVAKHSDRVKLIEMGPTEEGRSQLMVVVSSAENITKLSRFKEISQKLARAEGLTDQEARQLALEGKAVVWIDGGLHATETVGSHQLIETLWRLVSSNDAETKRILDEVIILLVHANPDGQELVADWYMQNKDTLKRSYSELPRLYEKYAGHDNNRDFYMMNLKETQNMSRQLYIEWLPQIIYNHHQAGPAGSVVAGPPYRDPFNYLFHPLVVTGIDAVGAAMINRLNAEDKPGYTERGGSVFSTWYNGGLRTTSYFHNMIGILTEIIGNPTPSSIPLVPSRLLPNGNTPFPVMPQKWNFRRSIDYSVSLNYAILDYAARNREHLLYNIYVMGKSAIKAGSRDNWTISSQKVEAINTAWKKDQKSGKGTDSIATPTRERMDTVPRKYFNMVLRDTLNRDPRGYVIPAGQPDFSSAVKFVNALIRSGIKVLKANAGFMVGGTAFLEGSFIVKTDQAFRAHVLDMFEPQDHPNDFLYPGGPPVRPYDIAGWTPAFSMGFRFSRFATNFPGPFSAIPYGEIQQVAGRIIGAGSAGYLLDARCDEAYTLARDLVGAGATVYRVTDAAQRIPGTVQGSFYVPAGGKADAIVRKSLQELPVEVKALSAAPAGLSKKIIPCRIGVWDMYGGSAPAGWMKLILEKHHFPYNAVFAREINKGNLKQKYDVLVFVGGAIPSYVENETKVKKDTEKMGDVPAELRYQWGKITADSSIVQLKKFMEEGGTIVTIGKSTNLAYHLKLPVKNALVEMNKGKEVALSSDKFYIPGSLLRVRIDTTCRTAWGTAAHTDIFFDSSPLFQLLPEATAKGTVQPLAWFDTPQPLRSGWALGQEYLQNGVAMFEANIGKGKLCAFGPEIAFRAQTYSTFKLLFNQFFYTR